MQVWAGYPSCNGASACYGCFDLTAPDADERRLTLADATTAEDESRALAGRTAQQKRSPGASPWNAPLAVALPADSVYWKWGVRSDRLLPPSPAHEDVTTMLSPQTQQISGSVTRVLTRREDTGCAVIEVENRGTRCTVVGALAHADEGLRIEAAGQWKDHPHFGRQFRARSARVFPPARAEGIERFLRSGAVAQVGPVFAKKIVRKFGDKTLHVIEHEPWRLSYLRGVGPKRIEGVIRGVKAHRDRMEIMSFLHGQLGPLRAQCVYDRYGTDARRKIAADPYRLMEEFDGFGWALSDKVARDVGVGETHPRRLQAAVTAVLQQGAGVGHTRLDESTCRKGLESLLGSAELAGRALEQPPRGWTILEEAGARVVEMDRYRFLDNRVANRLRTLVDTESATPAFSAERAIPWAEARIGLTFEPGQSDAIAGALEEKVVIVTGGPGVGKTTILKGLLEIWSAKRVAVSLAAPTGRAARRMTESTGREAHTLHRLLAYMPGSGFSHNADNPLHVDALVVDESSMVDLALMRSVLEALPHDARLVLVGDRDQLPSVGPGQVFGDLIDSGAVAVRRLTTPFRQAAHSPIVANAHLVNAGMAPDLDSSDAAFEFVDTQDTADTADALEEVLCNRMPAAGYDPRRDVMCLSPLRGGPAGVSAMNERLQGRLNPSPREFIEWSGTRFGVGDKVMQQKNNATLDINNGDLGLSETIDHKAKLLRIRFDRQIVEYPFAELSRLALAYCCTMHKSQGSEYPVVVVAVDRGHTVLLDRKLLYTAITRATDRVVLVGQRRAVHVAVSEARANVRQTGLVDRIRDAFAP